MQAKLLRQWSCDLKIENSKILTRGSTVHSWLGAGKYNFVWLKVHWEVIIQHFALFV